MGAFQAGTPIFVMVAVLAVSGIFRSVGFSAYNSVAFSDVPTEQMTHANTLHATLQELGAGLGIAVGALLVRLGDPVSAGARTQRNPSHCLPGRLRAAGGDHAGAAGRGHHDAEIGRGGRHRPSLTRGAW